MAIAATTCSGTCRFRNGNCVWFQQISPRQRRIDTMNTFLHQLAAVLTSLILALPPGSCSVLVTHNLVNSAPAKKASCCHETVPRPCDSDNLPSKPSIACCCVHDATIPERSVQPTETHQLAFTVAADHSSVNVGNFVANQADFTPIRSGPRLQILLCVWRC